MISLCNVHKVYPPEQPALKSINLRLGEGEFVFVAGPSGAGKSTLLKLLFGAERPSAGEVVVAGRNMSEVGPQEIAYLRREIGIVFQDYKLLLRRSVIDNVAFGLEVLGVKARARYTSAMRLLEVLGLADRARSMPLALSGGEQQRVAIARALIHKPRLILADEPTGNLDPDMTKVVFDLLLEANAAGVTVLVATHNLAVIEELNLRTVVLDRGRIIGNFQKPRALE